MGVHELAREIASAGVRECDLVCRSSSDPVHLKEGEGVLQVADLQPVFGATGHALDDLHEVDVVLAGRDLVGRGSIAIGVNPQKVEVQLLVRNHVEAIYPHDLNVDVDVNADGEGSLGEELVDLVVLTEHGHVVVGRGDLAAEALFLARRRRRGRPGRGGFEGRLVPILLGRKGYGAIFLLLPFEGGRGRVRAAGIVAVVPTGAGVADASGDGLVVFPLEANQVALTVGVAIAVARAMTARVIAASVHGIVLEARGRGRGRGQDRDLATGIVAVVPTGAGVAAASDDGLVVFPLEANQVALTVGVTIAVARALTARVIAASVHGIVLEAKGGGGTNTGRFAPVFGILLVVLLDRPVDALMLLLRAADVCRARSSPGKGGHSEEGCQLHDAGGVGLICDVY